jgi:protein SCO1/2
MFNHLKNNLYTNIYNTLYNTLHIYRWYICIGLIIALSACTPKPPTFTATDITGSNIATVPWVLYDAQSKAVKLDNFKGKTLVIFFGFTRCPDVCPTTLMDYAYVLKALRKENIDTSNIQVVLVTLDPKRDTFPELQQFAAAFDTSFIALRGDESATKTAADSFKIFYTKNNETLNKDNKDNKKDKEKSINNYSIDHTAASYIFDKQGRIRLFVRHGQSIDSLVQDLKNIL